MDILWAAVGISLIVGFVFYVLAGHFGAVLRQQASAIRMLSNRVRLMEEVENPQFRQKIGESVPPPLEQIFTFSFRLSDRFWRETLGLSEDDWRYVCACGAFVGSVKLERWRSHMAALITEVLPNRRTAAWQTRSLQYYPAPGAQSDSLTLWELPLGKPTAVGRPDVLELALRGSALTLSTSHAEAMVFFRTPLDLAALSEFRAEDPALACHAQDKGNGHAANTVPWQTFYCWADEPRGIEWQMQVRDLCRKAEWERWKILESPSVPSLRNRL